MIIVINKEFSAPKKHTKIQFHHNSHKSIFSQTIIIIININNNKLQTLNC